MGRNDEPVTCRSWQGQPAMCNSRLPNAARSIAGVSASNAGYRRRTRSFALLLARRPRPWPNVEQHRLVFLAHLDPPLRRSEPTSRRRASRVEPAGESPGAMVGQEFRPLHPARSTPVFQYSGGSKFDEEVGPDWTRNTTCLLQRDCKPCDIIRVSGAGDATLVGAAVLPRRESFWLTPRPTRLILILMARILESRGAFFLARSLVEHSD